MTAIETYRANAAAERLAADKTPLPNKRAMHLRAAFTWDTMAQSAEDTIGRAAANQAAKLGANG